MTSRGEEFGDTSSVESSLGETEGSSQSSTAGANDNRIILMIDHRILVGNVRLDQLECEAACRVTEASFARRGSHVSEIQTERVRYLCSDDSPGGG